MRVNVGCHATETIQGVTVTEFGIVFVRHVVLSKEQKQKQKFKRKLPTM
jgi:hypothetical protein